MFKDEMAKLIEQGKKTATRRFSTKKFYKVGSIQPVQRNYYDKATLFIKILKRYPQKLRDMTDNDAKLEGFIFRNDFLDYVTTINAKTFKKMGIETMQSPLTHNWIFTDAFLDLEPTVYEFEIVLKKMENDFNGRQVFCGKELTLEMFKQITGEK
jgi:uncharacterized protein YqfB (UPF0267 family)